MLTTTYTDTLKTTLERRRNLKQTKIFDCDCKRCEDPTEYSTYGSSFLCKNCGGFIISRNPLDNNSDWMCEKCKSQYSREVNERQTSRES
jgi:formylmethanofuran dehydrogenase subunit E